MFKIPFSGNSKVIDLLQVTRFTWVFRVSKTKFQKLCYRKGLLFTAGQTIQKMHYILQVDGDKETVIASFWSVKFEFV